MLRLALPVIIGISMIGAAALAQDQGSARVGTQWSLEEYDKACAPLLKTSAGATRLNLLQFKTVFGKPAIRWDEKDYQQVINLARACHGYSKQGTLVDGNNWRAMIEAARDKVLPVAERSIQVEEYAAGLAKDAIKFPQCSQLLEFEIDPVSMKDSSAEMFGQSFMLMSDKDLNASVQYVNECLLFLPDYAQAVKGWREAQGKEHLHKIMDKPLIILKRRQEWRDWEKRPSDLLVQDEFGAVIPPTMTSKTTREMILRYNKAAALIRRFTPETISILVKLADDVTMESKNAYDIAYAEAVRRRVQDEIFRRP